MSPLLVLLRLFAAKIPSYWFQPQPVHRRARQERRRPSLHPVVVPRAVKRRERMPAGSAGLVENALRLAPRRNHHALRRAEVRPLHARHEAVARQWHGGHVEPAGDPLGQEAAERVAHPQGVALAPRAIAQRQPAGHALAEPGGHRRRAQKERIPRRRGGREQPRGPRRNDAPQRLLDPPEFHAASETSGKRRRTGA